MKTTFKLILTTFLFVLASHVALAAKGDSLATLLQKASQGDGQAQYELGRSYDQGIGVAQSDKQALQWYRKAAAQNSPQAQYQLGRKYSVGEGVPVDMTEAVRWFRQAALQKYALAQNRLGRCYELGQGVQQNVVEAYKWYSLAARNPQNIFAVANRHALASRMTEADIIDAQLRVAATLAAR